MKLFQIEEPEGSPADPNASGVAIGIDAAGALAEVAVAVGGNAVVLGDREGFERALAVPVAGAPHEDWVALFEGARLRAERALAQPVTHAVLVTLATLEPAVAARLLLAGDAAGLTLLSLVARAQIAPSEHSETPALAAAILAEDLAPRAGAADA